MSTVNESSDLDLALVRGTHIEVDVQFMIARLAAAGKVYAKEILRSTGLNLRQFALLSFAATGLKPSQREMSNYLAMDPPQIVALVDALEERGLVERILEDQDRRSKRIIATRAGLEIFYRTQDVPKMIESLLLRKLEPSEREEFRLLLVKALL